ncbi:hypothetical protein AOA80_01760 [Methanomassiliicoccales archaeon RumEn M1]|jgi:uncharacterized protein with PIN domain|nr:hypothetical protein AOA80_01760 [Methanomassiliicoccales archaeon RumEn M1]
MTEPRFLADEMLGSLARWLRIMGYDAEYARDMRDDDILRQAVDEERMLLTRDRELASRAGDRGILLQGDDAIGHLEAVVRRFDLTFDEERTRCALCNRQLVPMSVEEAAPRVPPRVLERHREFLTCPSCGRVYWKGTHWTGICGHVGEAVRRARTNSGPR